MIKSVVILAARSHAHNSYVLTVNNCQVVSQEILKHALHWALNLSVLREIIFTGGKRLFYMHVILAAIITSILHAIFLDGIIYYFKKF